MLINKFGNIASNNTIAQQKGVGGEIKDADLDKEADGLIKKTNLYTNTCGTVFAGMCTAAQTIHKDFMKLIKAHVSSYLGDKETPDQAARSAASYGGYTPDQNTIPNLQERIKELNDVTDKDSPQGKERINQILNAAAANVNNSRTFASAEDIQSYIDSIKPQQQPAQGQQ